MDGDNDIDIAVARMVGQENLDKVAVLLNHGDGTFDSPFFCRSGQGPSVSVFCADLDNDVDVDLAVNHANTNNVSIYLNLLNSRPHPYSLVTPYNLQSITSPVNFDWEDAVDPDSGDTVLYCLFVSKSQVFNPDSTTIYDSMLQSYITVNLGTIGSYYWKVKAYDTWGAVRWSNESWSFDVFLRGDTNGNGMIELGDVVYLINALYKGGPAPQPLSAGDVNCSGMVELGDVVYLITYLYKGGPPPPC